MTQDDGEIRRKERARRRIRSMRAITAQAIEQCDADAVVLLMSFSDGDETVARMTSWGNGIVCNEMIKAARLKVAEENRKR